MVNHVYSLLLAIFIDLIGINLPNKFHPVAWMGSFITWMQHFTPSLGNNRRLIFGGLLSLTGLLLCTAAGYGLESLIKLAPSSIGIMIEGFILSIFFSISGLSRAASQIYQALLSNDLPEAQRLLSWHLVSRDTSTLEFSQLAAATIESVAENTSDSFIAPVFYFLLFGFPGLLVYRFANTADAMLGYHTPEKEWLGKIPARLDDLLNLVPARITAILLAISSLLNNKDTWRAISTWWTDRYRTSSPNAGHPMSVMAGALNIELAKEGHYCLGAGGKQASIQDIRSAVRMMYLVLAQVSAFSFLFIIIHECVQ